MKTKLMLLVAAIALQSVFAADSALYCVIDLSAGANASSYPVTYMNAPPSGGFNTDEYKTTKLVLRRIEVGTFIMGADQTDESHRVTLTKPFYMGVFEVTQKQYLLVTGTNPSNFSGDTLPVEKLNYDMIRGSSTGAQWPSSSAVNSDSFMGKLRVRTGLDFDLPTDAQWEYACRAGTTTTYYWGDSRDDSYFWHQLNTWESRSTQIVGTTTPNAWGLYDMSGNVWEWCLDWYDDSLAYGTDPQGPTSGSDRVGRNGCWDNVPNEHASSYRYPHSPSETPDSGDGFRLCCAASPTGTENDTPSSPTETCVVAFGADGDETIRSVVLFGASVGVLPTPHERGPIFDGWWTEASGGTQITSSTKVTGDVTFYPHWKYDYLSGDYEEGIQTIDGFQWRYAIYNGEEAEVRGVSPSDLYCAVTIPPKLGGKPVTSIWARAFEGNAMKSATIPDGVRSIGFEAFCGCERLTSVKIPNSVTSIGSGAFSGCVSLTSLTMPNGVVDMGDYVFGESDWYCAGLVKDDFIIVGDVLYLYVGKGTHVDIPSGVKKIARRAFTPAPETEEVWDDLMEDWCEVEVEGAYKGPESITIPNGVAVIDDEAFGGCSALKSVTIPNGVRLIGLSAFGGCDSLTSVTIPDSVSIIGAYAFDTGRSLNVSAARPLQPLLESGNVFGNPEYDEEMGESYNPPTITYRDVENWGRWDEDDFGYGIYGVTAKPQGGKVEIAFKVGDDVTENISAGQNPVLVITARDTATGKTVTSVTSALSGDTGCVEGAHLVVWDMAKQGVSVSGSKVVFTVSYVVESPYCVIDLSAGTDAASYLVSYLDDVPAGGWTDEYKTSKLVLKKIAPGSFTVDEWDDDVINVVATYTVSLTKPFYMGVFEVTQKQFELVTGQNPSRYKGDARPVECVSWDNIRGNAKVYNWPKVKTVDGNSFVGRLRAKTGISVDLPTLAQGEYAFHADEDSMGNVVTLGRIPENASDNQGGYGEHTKVGSYNPNSWGLYDMYGNVSEWALDWEWYVSRSESDPTGPNSNEDDVKMMCGASWNESYDKSYWYWEGGSTVYSSDRISDLGFRLAGVVPEGTVTGRTICSGDSEPVETAPVYTFFTGYKMTVNVKLKGYTAKGLPSGLKYDSKKGTVSGAAKKATTASGVTVTFTKKGKPTEKVVIVVRKEVLSAGCEDLDGATVAAGIGRSGTIPLQLSTESGVKSVAVSGLPPGMKFDAKKRVITGFPTKGGDYTVTIKLTGKTGVSKTVKLTMHVDALPTTATGTFHGFATTEAGKTLGAFTLTAASSGALTAKVVGAKKTYAFSKSGWDSAGEGVYVAELATKAGDRLVLRVDSTAAWTANQATGAFTPAVGDAAAVSAQRRAFSKTWRFVATGDAQSGWTLAYAESSAAANITVSLAADGVTTLAGKLGTYAVSASGYANVGSFKDGVLIADFAPIVTVGKGKTAKKLQFVVLTNLWLDSASAPDGDVGTACVEQ